MENEGLSVPNSQFLILNSQFLVLSPSLDWVYSVLSATVG